MNILLILLIAFFNLRTSFASNVFEFMDLQTHMTMHLAYPFFGDSLTDKKSHKVEKLTHKHMLKNVIFPHLIDRNSGARILVNGAISLDLEKNPKRHRKNILSQIKAINDFVKTNSDSFIVAKSPHEVRWAIQNTNKTVIIHSIEGAKGIIDNQEDAQYWANLGVAFVTLIHLYDDEFGSAALNPGTMGGIINFPGFINKKVHPHRNRGLSEHGKNAIKWLANAGVMTDLSHMAPDSVEDALMVLKKLNLPPLVTHSTFEPIQKSERSITLAQLITIYSLGGLYSLPINGENLIPRNPDPDFQKFVKGIKLCDGSLDSYRVSFNYVEKKLKEKFPSYDQIQLSLGWQSDFNGWTNHSRPRYGKKGCYSIGSQTLLPEIELKGLAHPGLLSEYWSALKNDGMNTDSLKYLSEKFLRMWEKFRDYKNDTLR